MAGHDSYDSHVPLICVAHAEWMTTTNQLRCPRCAAVNAPNARYCQQCGQSLLGPAGGKGAPPADQGGPAPGGQPDPGQHYPGYPQRPGGGPPWGQAAAGGIIGFLLGSLFGGGRGWGGGWGGGWGDGDWDGGDWGGGGDFGGGDFGGGGGGDGG